MQTCKSRRSHVKYHKHQKYIKNSFFKAFRQAIIYGHHIILYYNKTQQTALMRPKIGKLSVR